MNIQQKVVVVIMDVLLIVELCVSMYFANQNQDSFTVVFIRYFLTMCIPTLLVAKILVKRLGSRDPEVQA
jgi:hypothetical protein